MKVGVFCIQPDADADPAIVARHAEDRGFSSYWVPDHIILPVTSSTKYPGNPTDGPDPDYLWQMPDPLIACMRAATATTKLEIGTAVLLVPERHPLHLAKEIASLDSFSEGRFHFGIGAGWNKEECEIFGGDFEHRWSQVREAIEVMKTCWIDEQSEFQGRYYDFPPVKCFPKPKQKPHPPIYLPSIMFDDNGWVKNVFRRIVRWGDGWLPVVREAAQITDGLDMLKQIADEEGVSGKEFRVNVLGAEGQWRTAKEMDALSNTGAEQVTIWLKEKSVDAIRGELDVLADELLRN